MEALQDYVFVMLAEQMKGADVSAYAASVDKLSKIVAAKETSRHMAELRKNTHIYSAPSKSFSKQFFESFPSFYRWKAEFGAVDRESLVASVGGKEEDPLPDRVKHTLDLIKFEIFSKRFAKAFESLDNSVTKLLMQTAASSVLTAEYAPEVTAQLTANLSSYHELLGSYLQLHCKLGNAEDEYRTALVLNPANIDAKLKLIMLAGEFGEFDKVESQYGEWLMSLISGVSVDAPEGGDNTIAPVVASSADRVAKAWILTHRAGLWTSRDQEGKFRPDAVDKALGDINAARALVGTYQ